MVHTNLRRLLEVSTSSEVLIPFAYTVKSICKDGGGVTHSLLPQSVRIGGGR